MESNEKPEESLDSELGMSIDDDEIRELFEQEPLWDSLISNKDPNTDLNNDKIDNKDLANNAIEDLIVANTEENTDSNDNNSLTGLEDIPEFPELSIDDQPMADKEISAEYPNKTMESKDPSTEDNDETRTVNKLINMMNNYKNAVIDSKSNVEQSPSSSHIVYNRSLRQRNPIQLNPFTVEYARYKNLLGRSKLKTWSSTQITDTQGGSFDESMYSQYIPSTKSSTSELSKRTSAPSNGANKKSKPVERSFPQDELPSFEKYGLDKLILPPTEETEKQKDKLITFKKKRKSKHHRITPRKIPRLQELSNKDIFAFDDNPQSIFNISRLKEAHGGSSTHFSDPEYGEGDSEDMDEDEIDTNSQLNFRKKKRRPAIIDSDEEWSSGEFDNDGTSSVSESTEMTVEEMNKIFNFSRNVGTAHDKTKRLERKLTDDDIVPVVADEFEYKDHKRPRVKLQDMMKKEKALRSVLPASFLKVYQREILEEDKRRAKQRKRAKPTKSSDNVSSEEKSSKKPIDDIFAAFQESQDEKSGSSDDDDGNSSAHKNKRLSMDDYIIRKDSRETSHNKTNNKPRHTIDLMNERPQQTEHPSKPVEDNSMQPLRSYSNKYPLHEAVEYNRIRRLYTHATKKKSTNQQSRKRKTGTIHNPKSTNISRNNNNNNTHIPLNNKSYEIDQPSGHVNNVEDTNTGYESDDFRHYNDDNMNEDDIEELQFEDFYDSAHPMEKEKQDVRHNKTGNTTFTYYYKYPSHDIKPTHTSSDNTRPVNANIPSLETVVKRIMGLDGARIKMTDSDAYLSKELLTPLLSSSHSQKSAYAHLQKDFENLEFFNMHFLWTDIVPKESDLINSLFFYVSKDIQSACSSIELSDELPGHDRFYTFVSLCLSLWIPCLPENDRHSMIDLFMVHIRNLAWLIPKLVYGNPHSATPWKAIMKLSIYVLDWTCRLHRLGVHPMDWSVVDYTQILLGVLVHYGYEDLKRSVEAWICLMQILSVSSSNNEFGFNEYVFLRQLKISIKKRVQKADNQELEIRKNTQIWAESLNHILDQFVMSS